MRPWITRSMRTKKRYIKHHQFLRPTCIRIIDSYYPRAGSVVGTQMPRFRGLYEEQQREAPDNIHYPFENEDEWQYGT
jgi:hypothetical protein